MIRVANGKGTIKERVWRGLKKTMKVGIFQGMNSSAIIDNEIGGVNAQCCFVDCSHANFFYLLL